MPESPTTPLTVLCIPGPWLSRSELVEKIVRGDSGYLFAESPTICAGQTFSTAADAPAYRPLNDAGPGYDADSLFANPFGYWRLAPV